MPRTMTRRRSAPADDYNESDNGPEDDSPPARGSRRGSGRSSAREEAPPARGSRRGRSTRDEEPEEDTRPSRRESRRPDRDEERRPSRTGTGGWGTFEKKKSEHTDFPDEYSPDEEQRLIKFLDDEPFSNYQQHWIERKGKKSFTCLEENCPLCDEVGDRPQLKVLFNIIDLADPDNPKLVIWKVGSQVAEQLKNFGKDSKTGPINRDDLYWSVSRSGGGKKGRVVTSLNPVKERDLESDWDTPPLSEEELDAFDKDAYDESVVDWPTRKTLQDIADEVT